MRSGSYLLILALAAVGACERGTGNPPAADPLACDADAALDVAVRFGERLQLVSTSAPDSVIATAVREHYGDVVTPELLADWAREPRRAPGREVSSPWPDRIEVREIEDDDGACDIEGEVVYVTSVEAGTGGAAARERVELRVVRADGDRWLISDVERQGQVSQVLLRGQNAPTGAAPATAPANAAGDTISADALAAVAVIRRYYDAIAAGDYRAAYLSWSDGGRRSGKSLEEFSAGFADTESVSVQIGQPGRVEGAAGSRYVTIPVEVRATTTAGRVQRFTGTYTLRRSVVDGATDEQRQWRITSAEIVER